MSDLNISALFNTLDLALTDQLLTTNSITVKFFQNIYMPLMYLYIFLNYQTKTTEKELGTLISKFISELLPKLPELQGCLLRDKNSFDDQKNPEIHRKRAIINNSVRVLFFFLQNPILIYTGSC